MFLCALTARASLSRRDGIGADTAAERRVLFGDNPQRIRLALG